MKTELSETIHVKDRIEWGIGPWTQEPDRAEWLDEPSGLPCVAWRTRAGHWCGYVGVPDGHPLYRRRYSDEVPALAAALERRKQQPMPTSPGLGLMLACMSGELRATPEMALDVHGGITYADTLHNHDLRRETWLTQYGFRGDRLWWFGFDCAHVDDAHPGRMGSPYERAEYRTLNYVRDEIAKLAQQLRSVGDAWREIAAEAVR